MSNSTKKLMVTKKFKISNLEYEYYSLQSAADQISRDISALPITLKILLENLLRNQDNKTVFIEDITALMDWVKTKSSNHEIAFRPARVLMQDFTGVPAIVDLAAMRDAMVVLGGNSQKINPLSPVDLVIDHSVQVDYYGHKDSFEKNVKIEFDRNKERYEFLHWGQEAFDNFRVVPPGTGICHQINLEYLARVVWSSKVDGVLTVYPDTVFGTDSHTTMVNGLAVLGWGVGGIEAEAAMLGQPTSMVIPEVIGFKLRGKLSEGVTATDLVLTVTNMLRKKGVVGKFVEFFGSGLQHLSLADRATIANMAPEYGATCGYFPIDQETLNYLHLSGREQAQIDLVEQYAKLQGIWHDENSVEPIFTDIIELDLTTVEPCMAGPKRPQDKVVLNQVQNSLLKELETSLSKDHSIETKYQVHSEDYKLGHGDLVIAAITSCTNTSNPSVMLAAGLVARKAVEKGIKVKPWVKTSLAPGSKVVTEYLDATNLQNDLDNIGFSLVGYGCTTCIGNSGPLHKPIEDVITANQLTVSAVLSGNRNFEGRIHPFVRANYLASPPLVVAYALAGTVNIDLTKDSLGKDKNGNDVYLKDIWPSNEEVAELVKRCVTPKMFREKYQDVFSGDKLWQSINIAKTTTYNWNEQSTYVKNPPYFDNMAKTPGTISEVKSAKLLALLGDSITTDHISPAGNIAKASPAAKYLQEHNVQQADFNSYGARRGNHEVMMRGTFANIRIKNELTPGIEGGVTTYMPTKEVLSIYDAAMKYKEDNIPLIIIAGKEYGTGSSRDWAAKGTLLLGVKAVIAESFERIHRSNLVGMGVLPIVFKSGITRKDLALEGDETFDLLGLSPEMKPKSEVKLVIHYANGKHKEINLICRVDTIQEIEYLKHSGVLPYMIRELL
ncbi:MAG: aconitate hydratase AcnA [Alphaproteobacteria bacterium]|jgi:aconitate hydratase